MYWTTLGKGSIHSANLNGNAIQILVEGLQRPQDIELNGNRRYWTDSGLGKLQSANLDGSNVKDLITGINPFGVAIAKQKIYWTDDPRKKIQSVNLDGSNIQDFAINVHQPYDIDAF